MAQTVTGELAAYELENGLGTALLAQTMPGELATYEVENGLGTAPLTQTVSGELADNSMIRVGTAHSPQKLRGETVNSKGFGTHGTDMKIMTEGSTLLDNVDTHHIINSLKTGVALTTEIGGMFGNKTNNNTLYVGGQTAGNVQTRIRELNMCEMVNDMDSGVGIAVTLKTGLAKATDNVSTGVENYEIIVENPGSQQAANMHLTQVHKANVGLGLATITRVGLKEKNDIMKCMSGAQGLTGSPKAKTPKNNKKIVSKIAPPNWLKKWQKIAAESPPVKKKLQILTPLKAKIKNPQHIFSSPKKKSQPQKSQKAKSLESIRKEQKKILDKKDQNIQKKKRQS